MGGKYTTATTTNDDDDDTNNNKLSKQRNCDFINHKVVLSRGREREGERGEGKKEI